MFAGGIMETLQQEQSTIKKEQNKSLDTTLNWIQSFEKLAGEPIMLTLSVSKGSIRFENCYRKSKEFDDIDSGDEDGPSIKQMSNLHKPKASELVTEFNYLG